MKDKTKKVIKSIGACTLACLGAVAFTGCDMKLEDDQLNKITNTIESTLTPQTTMALNKEQAWDLVQLAEAKLNANANGIRDNLKVTIENSTWDDIVTEYLFCDEFGNYTAINKFSEHTLDFNLYFTFKGASYEYYHEQQGTSRLESSGSANDLEKTFNFDEVSQTRENSITSDDIVECRLLDNGNYLISFLKDERPANSAENKPYTQTVVETEITPDAVKVSESCYIVKNTGTGDTNLLEYFNVKISYSYNVVTPADYQECLAIARAAVDNQ